MLRVMINSLVGRFPQGVGRHRVAGVLGWVHIGECAAGYLEANPMTRYSPFPTPRYGGCCVRLNHGGGFRYSASRAYVVNW
jgi:hypothetical protein